jgi:signal transduction histidine kinase
MDRMTTPGNSWFTSHLIRLRANWPALLLPLLAAFALGLIDSPRSGSELMTGSGPVLLIIAVVLVAALAPAECAKIVPFALFACGAYGIFLTHLLLIGEKQSVFYGFVHAATVTRPPWRTSGPLGLVLTEAVAFMAAGVCLLARSGAPGGQPRTVPPLLLLPVLFGWEELFGQHLWFGQQGSPSFQAWPQVIAALIVAAGVAAVRWLPRAAAMLAVAGMVILGLIGMLWPLRSVWTGLIDVPHLASVGGSAVLFYGAVPLDSKMTRLAAGLQGLVLLGAGCALAPRLLTWGADAELAERARALARRVDGLTRTRSDATDTAVAELRRIERDLHDGAQARMVAVGMSLRAAEQLMPVNPEAALALVAEARETSSRAIADLRDLVRGIYPPVLADRGLAEAVRNLALDAVMDVNVHVDLPAEPPMPVAAAVYFAVAEALNNAVLHAEASTVEISVAHAAGAVRASVTDDGHGGADVAHGTGLSGVERRLATFDGILAVSSPAGGPTIVAIEVPCALSSVKTSSC